MGSHGRECCGRYGDHRTADADRRRLRGFHQQRPALTICEAIGQQQLQEQVVTQLLRTVFRLLHPAVEDRAIRAGATANATAFNNVALKVAREHPDLLKQQAWSSVSRYVATEKA